MSTIKLPELPVSPESVYFEGDGDAPGELVPMYSGIQMRAYAEEAVRQALAAQVPVAWMDDGSLRAGSEATAHRVVTDATRRGMNASVAGNFKFPLALIPEKDHGEST